MTKVKSIGVIVEDNSDYLAIRTLVQRIAKKDNLTFKKVIGYGCGKIKNKCFAWSQNLHRRGCNMLLLIHDLDRNELEILKKQLNDELNESPIRNRLVCIPREEIEAWLLSDPQTLKDVFKLKRLPKIGSKPELIKSPKEKLRDYIYSCSNKKVRFLTKHNEKIAAEIPIDQINKKCKSFRPFYDFVSDQTYK